MSQLENYFPSDFGVFYEPFFGGGAVYFYLNPKKAVINDINKKLMDTYRAVKQDPNQLIKALKILEEEYLKLNQEERKLFYYDRRKEYNETTESLRKSVLLIFLNKTCFNGIYRENKKGGFNVPIGSYKNPKILHEDKILLASRRLQETKILSGSYKKCVEDASKNDFIYLDPPYHPLNTTSSFTSYSKDDFGTKDQEELAALFNKLSKRGCKVMLSNSDTPFIRKLYSSFNIQNVMAARSINSDASKRGKIKEVVVTNYVTEN